MDHEPEFHSSRPFDRLLGTEDDKIPRVMSRAIFDQTPDHLLCPTLYAHQVCVWSDRITDEDDSPRMPRGFEMISVLSRFDCMTRWCRRHPEECLDAEETVISSR